ncbi:MAG: hypothetical protein IJS56_03860 [Bacilli bacterium]|nr:hypothetical protein [Bacilli bacterium]
MVSEDKVRQIISSLKETSVYSFDLEQFKQLLTLLNKLELVLFKEILVKEGENNILNQYSLIEEEVFNNIDRQLSILDNDEVINMFKASLLTNKYVDYMSHLNVNDLTNLKFYVSNKVNIDNKDNLSGTIKILRIISRLLKEKETHKLNFNE